MSWLWLLPLTALLLAQAAFIVLLRRRMRLVRCFIEEQYGPELRLITPCGMISGPNRTPGMLALTKKVLVYRDCVLSNSGEIAVDNMVCASLEPAHGSKQARARKYRRAFVLEIRTYSGKKPPLFVLCASDASSWREVLKAPAGH